MWQCRRCCSPTTTGPTTTLTRQASSPTWTPSSSATNNPPTLPYPLHLLNFLLNSPSLPPDNPFHQILHHLTFTISLHTLSSIDSSFKRSTTNNHHHFPPTTTPTDHSLSIFLLPSTSQQVVGVTSNLPRLTLFDDSENISFFCISIKVYSLIDSSSNCNCNCNNVPNNSKYLLA